MEIYLLILTIMVSLLVSFLLFWKFIFLRNPKRIIPKGENIISPNDGKIIDILEFKKNKEIEFFKGNKKYLGIIKTLTKDVASEGIIISIFMNPLNVHYIRSPIKGKVKSAVHRDGKLLPVNTIENGLMNEKTEIMIEGRIKLKVILIAGFIARRIESFVTNNDEVRKGDIIGLINLGSQVTIILPSNIKLKVKKGDKVTGGETIIGLIK